MDHQALKARHRQEREGHHPNLTLRVHRALSWLNRAEQADDLDGRFIFLWIAFNSAYATDIDEQFRLSEQSTFKAFLDKLCALDTANLIENLVRVLRQYPRIAGQPLRISEFLGQPERQDQRATVDRAVCQRSTSSAASVSQPQYPSSTRCSVQSNLYIA